MLEKQLVVINIRDSAYLTPGELGLPSSIAEICSEIASRVILGA